MIQNASVTCGTFVATLSKFRSRTCISLHSVSLGPQRICAQRRAFRAIQFTIVRALLKSRVVTCWPGSISNRAYSRKDCDSGSEGIRVSEKI